MKKAAISTFGKPYRLLVFLFLLTGLANFFPANCFAIDGLVAGKYIYQPNDSACFHNEFSGPLTSQQSPLSAKDMQQLMHYAPDGFDYDILQSLKQDACMKGAFYVDSLKEGTHMVILHSKNFLKEFTPDSLRSYIMKNVSPSTIKNAGASEITNSNSTIQYQLSFKSIVQVGKKYTENASLKTSLPLDIVPEQNVYAIKEGKPVSITLCIYFKGQPVKNALIRILHKNVNGDILSETIFTSNKKGRIKIPVDATGEWIANAVHMVKSSTGSSAALQTYLASVSWGYK